MFWCKSMFENCTHWHIFTMVLFPDYFCFGDVLRSRRGRDERTRGIERKWLRKTPVMKEVIHTHQHYRLHLKKKSVVFSSHILECCSVLHRSKTLDRWTQCGVSYLLLIFSTVQAKERRGESRFRLLIHTPGWCTFFRVYVIWLAAAGRRVVTWLATLCLHNWDANGKREWICQHSGWFT